MIGIGWGLQRGTDWGDLVMVDGSDHNVTAGIGPGNFECSLGGCKP